MDYSKCAFPIPYSDPELGKHWFDFNDSAVEPIMPGTLQKMFGGTSANAYMLVYRQRKVGKEMNEQPEIPDYWVKEIEKINQEDATFRENYESLRNQFDIVLQDANAFFNVDDNDFVSYIDPEKTLE